MIRRSIPFAVLTATLALACTSERAANLRHPVGGTDRFTISSVPPEERYARPPLPSPPSLTSAAAPPSATAPCDARPPAIDFYAGSTKLEAEQAVAVDRVAKCLLTDLRGVAVVLVGRADPGASSAAQRAMGDVRARQVRDHLIASGVAADRIVIAAPAEPPPACIGLGRTSGVQILLGASAPASVTAR